MQSHSKADFHKRESTYRQIQDDMRRKLFLHRHNVMPLAKYRAMIVDVRDID